MKPTLSIVTPSFNQGRFIERTIQSVLSQKLSHLEYVVVDGGSTDETLNILKKHSNQLRWSSEIDRGQTHAINKGIHATSGEIFGWLNSDDIYYPGALKKVLLFFAAHPEIDILYGKADHIDEEDKFIEPYPILPWNLEKLKETCFLSQPSVFFRRRMIEKFGPLNESLHYCLDYEYWLRLAFGGAQFAHLPKVLAATRLYADTKTLGSRVAVHKEINDMMLKKFNRVPDRWLFNYAHVILEKKKMTRSNRWLFTPALVALSFIFALRWNKKVTLSMLGSMWQWLCHAIKHKKATS